MATTSLSTSKVGRILFEARLYREGRLHEYYDARLANKNKFANLRDKTTAANALKREFGYVGSRHELELVESEKRLSAVHRRKEAMAEAGRNRGRTAIEKALDELPDVAPVEQEMAWVRSHPKMTRALTKVLIERGEEYTPPKPVASDISNAKRPCPSRGAWNTLLAALANPKKFNDVLLTKQKDGAVKSNDGGGELNGIVADDGLAALKRVHEQFMLQQQAK